MNEFDTVGNNQGAARIVMFDKVGGALYLSGARYDAHGDPVSGYVENGGWDWRRSDQEETSSDTAYGDVRNRWARRDYTIVPVGDDWRGDHNAIIERAREALRDEHDG